MDKITSHETCVACMHNKVCKFKDEFHKLSSSINNLLQGDEEDRINLDSLSFEIDVKCKHQKDIVKNPR